MRCLAAFSIACLAAFAPNAAAAPIVVRLGTDRVVLDSPAGYSDSLGLASPRLQELAEAQTSPSNKVLLFAITDADLKRFMTGDLPDFRRYMIAAIPARLEHERIGAGQFAALADEALREMGAAVATADYAKHLDALPRAHLHRLADLRRTDTVLSVLQGTRLPARRDEQREKPRYLLSTTTLLLVRGKALTLSVFTGYDSPIDAEWIRAATLAWIDELLRLNRNP